MPSHKKNDPPPSEEKETSTTVITTTKTKKKKTKKKRRKTAGPKMGNRPADFNESAIRQTPTFQRWLGLPPGACLRYACRDYVKDDEEDGDGDGDGGDGNGDGDGSGDSGNGDEERLMRRIMIVRRANLRDAELVKKAKSMAEGEGGGGGGDGNGKTAEGADDGATRGGGTSPAPLAAKRRRTDATGNGSGSGSGGSGGGGVCKKGPPSGSSIAGNKCKPCESLDESALLSRDEVEAELASSLPLWEAISRDGGGGDGSGGGGEANGGESGGGSSGSGERVEGGTTPVYGTADDDGGTKNTTKGTKKKATKKVVAAAVDAISRKFTARNFQSALDCINAMGNVAEREGHHPDFHLTSYRNVEVVLYTHSLGGVSANDVALAKMLDEEVDVDYSPKWLEGNPKAKMMMGKDGGTAVTEV